MKSCARRQLLLAMALWKIEEGVGLSEIQNQCLNVVTYLRKHFLNIFLETGFTGADRFAVRKVGPVIAKHCWVRSSSAMARTSSGAFDT